MFFRLLIVLAAYATVSSISRVAEPIDIGSRLELFVDRYLIQDLKGVQLKLHEPVRLPIPGQAPQGQHRPPVSHYMTIIQDGELYRAYYRDYIMGYKGPFQDGGPQEITCYAASRNGHQWSTPKLGLFEINGSRENNAILAQAAPFSHNFTPFLDLNPKASKEQRYKALAGTVGSGLVAFISEDGLRWKKLRDDPVIPSKAPFPFIHLFDSQNTAFWSEAEALYICYFRVWDGVRRIARTTSRDFVAWSEPVLLAPNEPGEHLYTSGTHPYFRAPHIYIALPTRFMPGRRETTDIVFMTSRAGEPFQRLFKEAFIRPGPDPERWGNRSNYVALNVVPTGPAEMSIYHSVSGYRYVLRTDGFVSVHAGYESGELLTKPFTFTGNKLVLNVSTSAAGQICVELQDVDGKSIPGYALSDCREIVGDRIDQVVAWKQGDDVSQLAGKPVRLRFVMKDADLYSIRFQR